MKYDTNEYAAWVVMWCDMLCAAWSSSIVIECYPGRCDVHFDMHARSVQDTNPFSEQKLQIESFRQYIECFNRKWESNVDPHSPCVTPIRCREGVTWLVNLSIVFTHCIGQTKSILPVKAMRVMKVLSLVMLSLTITFWGQCGFWTHCTALSFRDHCTRAVHSKAQHSL